MHVHKRSLGAKNGKKNITIVFIATYSVSMKISKTNFVALIERARTYLR